MVIDLIRRLEEIGFDRKLFGTRIQKGEPYTGVYDGEFSYGEKDPVSNTPLIRVWLREQTDGSYRATYKHLQPSGGILEEYEGDFDSEGKPLNEAARRISERLNRLPIIERAEPV